MRAFFVGLWTVIVLCAIGAIPTAHVIIEASAQTCPGSSGFLTQDGPISLGDSAIFGPDCGHLQDGGLFLVGGRIVLPASTTQLFQNGTTGSDTTLGLSNPCANALAPCKTMQHVIMDIAFNSYIYNATVTTQVFINAAGVSVATDTVHLAGRFVGSEGNLKVIVDGTAGFTWNTNTGPPIAVEDNALIAIQNLTLGSTGGSGNCAEINRQAHIILTNITYLACTGAEIFANNQSFVEEGGTHGVNGNFGFATQALNASLIISSGMTYNILTNITFTDFVYASNSASVNFANTVINPNGHTIHGTKFLDQLNSFIATGLQNGDLNYFPGDVGSAPILGGFYDTVLAITPVASGGTGDNGSAWSTFVPALSCGTATFTVNSARQKTLGKTQHLSLDATITGIGTCTNQVNFNVPFTAQSGGGINGRETVNTGYPVDCNISPASATANCNVGRNDPWTVNMRLMISGVFELQ